MENKKRIPNYIQKLIQQLTKKKPAHKSNKFNLTPYEINFYN